MMEQSPYECGRIISIHVYATEVPSSGWVLAVHDDP